MLRQVFLNTNTVLIKIIQRNIGKVHRGKNTHPAKNDAQLRNQAGHDYQPEINQPKPIAVLNVVFFSATDNSRLKVKITTTGLIKKWADSTTGRQAGQTVK